MTNFHRLDEILNEVKKARTAPASHKPVKFPGGYRLVATCMKCGKTYSYTRGGFKKWGLCPRCESESLTPEEREKRKRLSTAMMAARKKIKDQ